MTAPLPANKPPRFVLQKIARRVMIDRGLEPDFPPAALVELAAIHGPAPTTAGGPVRDLRNLLWCSIDNDDSRDLDQLSVAEALPDAAVKLMVAVADVATLVKQGSALDTHARKNTTSVYTAAQIFPMLPEKLSTDLTSLNFAAERRAIVVEMVFARDGSLTKSDIYEAVVKNQAKLAYNSVAAWLDHTGPTPAPLGAVAGLPENLRLQHGMTQILRARRHKRGALSLQTIQARAVYEGDILQDLAAEESNVAKNLIEDLMVAANGVAARFLAAKKTAALRRVVRTPLHWDRIVELAAMRGASLPKEADGAALEEFLLAARAKDPATFPDLSLSVIKLMGAGEYVVERPGGDSARTLRPRGEGLRTHDRAEPPVSRPDPPAPAQGRARGPPAALLQRRAGRARPALHRAGGRREESGTPGREVRGGDPPRPPPRRKIRRDRDRSVRQRRVGAAVASADRGKTGHAARRPKSRRPPPRQASPHRPRARLYRFRSGRLNVIRDIHQDRPIMEEDKKSKPSLRARADRIKDFRCKNLIAVIEQPEDLRNIGTIIRNVNALGVEKAYVVTDGKILPDDWQEMRSRPKLNALSASAIKWSFVRKFNDTESCLAHLEKNGFVSLVTSPHTKGRKNVVLHEADYTKHKKLAVWFGNEGIGISRLALERSEFCVNIPMFGIIESLNLGTSSGIVFYEITKQRRAFQEKLNAKIAAKKQSKSAV